MNPLDLECSPDQVLADFIIIVAKSYSYG